MKLFTLLGTALLLFAAAQAPALEAGAARSRLTVPQGIPLGGHADRKGREALGEHDPLWVRCLYLDDGEAAAYLVSVDLSHIPPALRQQVVDLAADFAPREQIFLTATHTHNGAGGMDRPIPMRWSSGRYHPEMQEIVAQAIVATMESARDQKRRATLGYAAARQQALSQNRFDSEGPTDDQIAVIRVDDADGKAIAVVASLAVRPDMVPDTHHYYFSSDFPGVYYKVMEELTDPACVAMFLAGAAADQGPGNPEGKEGWEHVESMGRLLATRVKEATNTMTFRDVKIRAAYLEADVPATLADAVLPDTAIFQMLELDGLQLFFVPGEPTAEIGLALRRDALAAGKATQITVALANDHLGTFVSGARYGDPHYQAAATCFGTDAEAWLQAQAISLSGGADSAVAPKEFPAATRQDLAGGAALTLRGPGYQRGFQRGLAVHADARARYAERIEAPVRSGSLRPDNGLWSLWPSLLDPASLALPALGRAARPMLRGLHADLVGEAEGFAAALELPLDAALLLQNSGATPGSDVESQALAALTGTLFAVAGERAGVDGIIAGANLDWPVAEAPIVSTVEPDEGHNAIFVGFDWQLGAMAGMNDAGLALCLARNTLLGEPESGSAPASLLIRQVVQLGSDFDEAMALLRASDQLRGHQVMLVAQSKKGWRSAVLSFGKSVAVREADNSVLLGLDPESGNGDAAAQERYAHAAARLSGDLVVGPTEAQALLTSGREGERASNLPWHTDTRASVVMLPGSLVMQVAFPDEFGMPGPYTEFRLEKAVRDE